jgi:homocysteine S-methyltransferase
LKERWGSPSCVAGFYVFADHRNVPDSIMERMARGTTKEEQRAEGIKIAREAVAAIRDKVAGVQVSAPFGNVKTAAAVIA